MTQSRPLSMIAFGAVPGATACGAPSRPSHGARRDLVEDAVLVGEHDVKSQVKFLESAVGRRVSAHHVVFLQALVGRPQERRTGGQFCGPGFTGIAGSKTVQHLAKAVLGRSS